MRRVAPIALVVLLVLAGWAEQKVRVFVTDSKSWSSGGAKPQTAEIIKTFQDKCPSVTITMKQEKADYIVLLDHEGGKGVVRKDNKVAVFNGEGDAIHSSSTRTLGGAVENACEAIRKEVARATK